MKQIQIETGKFWLAGILFLLGSLPGITNAQVPIPAGVEGAIGSIIGDGNGGAIVNVMGIDVYVPASVFGDPADPANPANPSKVTTPTAKLNLARLLDTTPLPGRSQPGFLGGTAISNGESTYNGDGTATFVAQDLFVEPAENVVIGVVTNRTGTGPCDIYLQGTHAVFSTDERMPFDKAINGSGFEIDPCTVVVGGSAAVEGYYGDADSKLHIFAFESDDADVLQSGVTTITRASCDRGRIEVRGASTLVAGTAVVKEHIDTVLPENQTVLGTANLQFDAVTTTSIYRFRTKLVTSDCPDFVRVESDVDGTGPIVYDSYVIAPVDIK